MQTGIFLVNGVDLPYSVIDRAIQWAVETQSLLKGLFLFCSEENAESYGFPSDIEQAETLQTEQEGEKEMEKLIRRHTDYAVKQADAKGIDLRTILLKDPSEEKLQGELKEAIIVWMDADTFQGFPELASTEFELEDIIRLAPADTVNIIEKEDSEEDQQ